jgi:hypothetical protein
VQLRAMSATAGGHQLQRSKCECCQRATNSGCRHTAVGGYASGNFLCEDLEPSIKIEALADAPS